MIIRETSTYDNTNYNYIASLVLICGIACTVTMLRFKGFKVKFSLTSRNKVSEEYYEDVPVVSYTEGVYTSNREEFYGNGSLADPPKRITPSMVKLPEPFQPDPTLRPNKSTSDLIQNQNNNEIPPTLRQSTPNVSMNPRGDSSNNRNSANVKDIKNKDKGKKVDKEQKLLEKKRLAEEKKRLEEEKKRDKLAAQAQAKEEKERKSQEKIEAQKQAKEEKLKKEKDKKDKNKAKDKSKEPKTAEVKQHVKRKENPLAQTVPNQTSTQGPSYSTNTLESSISKSSGPPGYVEPKPKTEVPKAPAYVEPKPKTEVPKAEVRKEVVKNQRDDTGNTSFGKPIDEGSSWELISQHRQQMSRPPVSSGGKPKQTVLDLQYTTGRTSVEI